MMKLKFILLSVSMLFIVKVYAQVDPIELNANELVSNNAFNKLLFNDLNFLILGENTPSQGFSTELTDGSSKLSLKGLILSKSNWLLTIDGNFSVDEGVYFFDEDGGSKQASFALNLFFAGNYTRNFNSANTPSVKRTLLNRNFLVKDTIYKAYEKFYKLQSLVSYVKIPISVIKDSEKVIINSNKPRYKVYEDALVLEKFIEDFNLENKSRDLSFDTNFKIINIDDSGQTQSTKKDTIVINPLNFKIGNTIVNPKKLIEAYEKSLAQINSLSTTVENLEIENATGKWTSKSVYYLGISPYYQRENITTFSFEEGVAFDKLFSDNTGDLYGLMASGNYFRQNKNWLGYARLLGKVGRGSNLASLNKKTYVFNTIIGNNGGEDIIVTNEKVGYSNSRNEDYTYGVESSVMIEAYGTYKNIGLFGQIGYNNLNFRNNTNVKNMERYPFRAGILLNLKDETKNIITLQVFVDRSDLSIDPTPRDISKNDDWRFGFKIGLPIFVKNQL